MHAGSPGLLVLAPTPPPAIDSLNLFARPSLRSASFELSPSLENSESVLDRRNGIKALPFNPIINSQSLQFSRRQHSTNRFLKTNYGTRSVDTFFLCQEPSSNTLNSDYIEEINLKRHLTLEASHNTLNLGR